MRTSRPREQTSGASERVGAQRQVWAGLTAGIVLLAGLFSAPAQDYRLGSFSAKTGSGTPASDDHMVTGGINLGLLFGAEDEDHFMGGGIRGGAPVVETIDGIRLTIRIVPGGVEVSWPEAEDYVLEATSDLSAPDWQPVTATPPPDSESSSIVVPIAEAAQFYRLRRVPAD